MEKSDDARPQFVDTELIRTWLYWSLAWQTVFPLVGLLVSIKFHNPEILGSQPWFTFGRLRPVHVNGVIFGAFSTPFLGLLYYLVPRLAGRPMAGMRFSRWALWGWQIFLITGTFSFLFGFNLGFEADEFEWPWNILRYAVLAVIGSQVLVTLFRRKEKGFYVALWYAVAALVWTLLNLILGNVILPYVGMSGISNTALHGLYIHYVVGLWITPAGLSLMYYFIPLSCKNPLFSHALSKFGFWTLALVYPFVGTHHYLFSPIPYHNQTLSIVTSMLLIIPVWAVVTNQFGTALGRWGAIAHGTDADSYGAKFLLLAVFYYLVGCFQGSTEALRRVQELTHFSDFVISHSHFTVFGTFVVAAVGSMYYVWPRVTGRQLWSARMASWHFWLTVAGASVMLLGLAAQGFIQGSMLEYGANFVDTVVEMKPWWATRTVAGATMDIGFLLMVVNFIQTARHGTRFEETPYGEVLQTRPAGEERRIISTPSGVVLIAGISYFSLAVITQGIWPSLLPQTNSPEVTDSGTGLTIKATDYTPQEKRGRKVYIREGCWYCHSQYIRPVTGETSRWGPVSKAGEYVYDQPHLLSTRRIGPDLFRVGRKYGDGWHTAHHWNPRNVVPDSIMPRFPWLFEPSNGDDAPELNDDGKALEAYIQKLGTNIGDWRESFTPTRLISGTSPLLSTRDKQALIPEGKHVYERRCIGCHGAKGDGKGPAARFFKIRPRDFTSGIFKFRSTPGQNSLPTDADLFITVTHGLWGTPMPPWYEISAEERLAVIQYIKTFSDRWRKETAGAPINVRDEPPVTNGSIEQGKDLFHGKAACFICHGTAGQGDGPLAPTLKNEWGFPEPPANFTLPAGVQRGVKLGHDGRHIFKTIMTGVGGTAMPVFQGKLTPAEVWDIAHFVQSLRVDAHLQELRGAGLAKEDENQARRRIWAILSQAADEGQIDDAVVAGHHITPEKINVASAVTPKTKGGPSP
jgi:cytochrome c oxidase cbb3-type subunit 1